MKTLFAILLAVILTIVCDEPMNAQSGGMYLLKPTTKPLKAINRETTANGVEYEKPYWKYWNSPSTWCPIDTSEAFMLSELSPTGIDTTFAYYLKSSATTAYHTAIRVQFGNGGTWATAYASAVDSVLRKTTSPGATLGAFAGDSILAGRSLHFILKQKQNAGADRVRLLIQKDTTNTVSGTSTYEMGFIYTPVKVK